MLPIYRAWSQVVVELIISSSMNSTSTEPRQSLLVDYSREKVFGLLGYIVQIKYAIGKLTSPSNFCEKRPTWTLLSLFHLLPNIIFSLILFIIFLSLYNTFIYLIFFYFHNYFISQITYSRFHFKCLFNLQI